MSDELEKYKKFLNIEEKLSIIHQDSETAVSDEIRTSNEERQHVKRAREELSDYDLEESSTEEEWSTTEGEEDSVMEEESTTEEKQQNREEGINHMDMEEENNADKNDSDDTDVSKEKNELNLNKDNSNKDKPKEGTQQDRNMEQETKTESDPASNNDIENTRKKWTKKSSSSSFNTNNNCKLIGYTYLEQIKQISRKPNTTKEELKIKAWELSLFERQLLQKECSKTQNNEKNKKSIKINPLYYKYDGIGENRILIISNHDIGYEDYMELLTSFKNGDGAKLELEVDTITPHKSGYGMLHKICKSLGGLQVNRTDSNIMSITKIEKLTESDKITYKKLLENYRNDPTQTHPIQMPKSLSNLHRRYIHELCNTLGLKSHSYGSKKKDNARYIEISKPEKRVIRNHDIFPLLVLGQEVDRALKRHVDLFPFEDSVDIHHPILKPYQEKMDKIKHDTNPKQIDKKPYVPKEVSALNDKQKLLHDQRTQLPIYNYRSKIISSVNDNPITIIIGDTGCGKSTQVPQYILESNPNTANIIVTQPRRISTIMLSQRISQEKYDSSNLIGYQIRLESKVDTNTRITFMTPGILLRKLQNASACEEYTHVILDEVHERDRYTEFVMIYLRDIITSNKKLKVILMSATMQVQELVTYWNYLETINPIVPIHVPGRMYPVQEYYLEDVLKYTDYMDYLQDDGIMVEKKFYKCLLCNNVEYNSYLELATHLASCTGSFSGDTTLDGTLHRYKELEQQILHCNHSSHKKKSQLSANASVFIPMSSDIRDDDIKEKEELEINDVKNEEEDDDYDDVMKSNTFTSQTITTTTESNTTIEEEELLKKYESTYNTTDNEYQINYDLILSILHYIISLKSNNKQSHGAILIFLPGWGEIAELLSILRTTIPFNNKQHYIILPLHSSISSYDQKLVFEKYKKRKIILSTNIAETSLTIEDVVYVIDSGLAKEKNYDPYLKMNTLTTQYISQSSAKQRMGRAGRVQPGICFRLYTKQRYYKSFRPFLESELLRTSLEEICLLIKLLHLVPSSFDEDDDDEMNNIQSFLSKALSPPNILSVQNAINTLIDLEAMVPNNTNDLTTLGYCLAHLSLEPRVGKMVLWSYLLGCADPTCSMAVSMSLKSPFVLPSDNNLRKDANKAMLELSCNSESDLITFVHLVTQVSTFNTMDEDDDYYKSTNTINYNKWRGKKVQNYSKQQTFRNFCSDYFLNYPTVKMIIGLRSLLSQELQKLGFQDPLHNQQRRNRRSSTSHNRYHREAYKEYAILQATIAAGLYPNIAYRRRKEMNFSTYASTLGFNTSKAKISVGSVNSIRSEDVPLSAKCMSDYEFLIFGEIIRGGSSNNFQLNQTTFLASPLPLFLLCGNKLEVINQGQDRGDEGSRYSHLTILSLDDWIQFYTYKDVATHIFILRHRLKNVFQHFVENRVIGNNKGWAMSKVDEDALKTLDIVLRAAHHHVCGNG